MIREFRFYRSARRRGLAQTRNCQQSKLFRQPRHRKFDKSVTKRPVSCDSICRNEVTMARHKGRGSPRPSTRASHPSAPCRIQSSLVLHGKHAFLGAFLSLSLVLTFWVPTVAAQGVGTTDEVHVAPRVLPDPAPAKEEVPTGSSFNTHSKPYKTESDLVLVPVTITDPMNRLVTGLDKENFNVFEGKEAQEIKHFSSEDAPVSLGVIFDMSGSMSSKIERAREAVVEFFKTANPQDEFFMITFSDKPQEISDFTQSVEDIQGKLVQAKYTKKSLLIISDGGDNHSRYTEGEIKSLVKEADVLVYAIGIYDKYFPTSEERLGPALLSDVAELTGGRSFTIDNPNDLADVATKIGIELRNQYVIGYRPKNPIHNGKWRKIKVKLNPPRGLPPLKVYAKTGYYAPVE